MNFKRSLFSHKRFHARLRHSEAQLRALVESSVDHMYLLDEQGTFLFSNHQVSQFGLSHGRELVGRRLQDVFPHNVCTLYRRKVKEVLDESRVVTFVHTRKTDNGSQFFQDTLFPVFRHNRIWALGGICRDVSEQKRIEKHLFQAQKMEALGTLVAGAAHEINNPVNLMQFNLPLLEKVWRDLMPMLDAAENIADRSYGGLSYSFIRENTLRLIADMQLATHRVARIVQGLKQFSRKSNPADKSDVQVNTAVENAARLAAATLSKSKTELKLVLAPHLPLLHANLQNLEQIVLNLMINAFQSIDHDKGWVQITTGWRPEDQVITIEVEDNGSGINPAVKEKLFDPFVSDRQAKGGTGLGLSVTFNLVKAHNGEITAESRPAGGTKFIVKLPTVDQRKQKRIMVVDDDYHFRSLLLRAFSQKTNCAAEGFANGAEALIRLGSDPPDVLVLDMFMPHMDGLGVCRAIKNELGLKTTRVVIVTGHPQHPNVIAAERLGFDQIVTKPLNMESFIEIIRRNLDDTPA